MAVCQGTKYLMHYCGSFSFRKKISFRNLIKEFSTMNKFRNHIIVLRIFIKFKETHNIWMHKLLQHLNLFNELICSSSTSLCITILEWNMLLINYFHCSFFLSGFVYYFIDLGESSFSYQLLFVIKKVRRNIVFLSYESPRDF